MKWFANTSDVLVLCQNFVNNMECVRVERNSCNMLIEVLCVTYAIFYIQCSSDCDVL